MNYKSVYFSLIAFSLLMLNPMHCVVAERFIVDPDTATITFIPDPSVDYDDICSLGNGNESLNNATWDSFKTAQPNAIGVWSGSVCNESLLNVSGTETDIDVWSSNIMAWDPEQIMSGASEGWVRSPYFISEDTGTGVNHGEMQLDIYSIDSRNVDLETRDETDVDYDIDSYLDFAKYSVKKSGVETIWDNPENVKVAEDIYRQWDYSQGVLRETFNNLASGSYIGGHTGSHGASWTWFAGEVVDNQHKTLHVDRWTNAKIIASDTAQRGLDWTGSETLGDDGTYNEDEASLTFWSNAHSATVSDTCMDMEISITDPWLGAYTYYVDLHSSGGYCTANYGRTPTTTPTLLDSIQDIPNDGSLWRGYEIDILDTYRTTGGTLSTWNGSQVMTFEYFVRTTSGSINKYMQLDDITFFRDAVNQTYEPTSWIEIMVDSDYIMEYTSTPADRVTWIGTGDLTISTRTDQYLTEYSASKNWNPAFDVKGVVWTFKLFITAGDGIQDLEFTLVESETFIPYIDSHPRLVFRKYYNISNWYNGDDHIDNFEIVNNRSYHKFEGPIFTKPAQYIFLFHIEAENDYPKVYFAGHDDGNDDWNVTFLNVSGTGYTLVGQMSLGISTLMTTGMGHGVRGYKVELEAWEIFRLEDTLQVFDQAEDGEYITLVLAFWNISLDLDIAIKIFSEDSEWFVGWFWRRMTEYMVIPVQYKPTSPGDARNITTLIQNPGFGTFSFYIWAYSEPEPSYSLDMRFRMDKVIGETDTSGQLNTIRFRPWHTLIVSDKHWEQVHLPTPRLIWDISVPRDFLEKVQHNKGKASIISQIEEFSFLTKFVDLWEFLTNNEATRWLGEQIGNIVGALNWVADWIFSGLNTVWNWITRIGTELFMIFKNLVSITLKIIEFVINIANLIIPIAIFVYIITVWDKILAVFGALYQPRKFNRRAEELFDKMFGPIRRR